MKAQCKHSDTGLCESCFEYEQKLGDCRDELEICKDANTQRKKELLRIKAKLDDLDNVILNSSLCHLCFASVSECEKEVKELAQIIRNYLKEEGAEK